MSAAFDWDKVMRLDPLNLHDCEKDQLDEVFNTFILVIVLTSQQNEIASQIFSVASPPSPLVFELEI